MADDNIFLEEKFLQALKVIFLILFCITTFMNAFIYILKQKRSDLLDVTFINVSMNRETNYFKNILALKASSNSIS